MDKLERVARALCAADGVDADAQVWTGQFDDTGAEQPANWQRRLDEARRFAAAFEAMQAETAAPTAGRMAAGTITSGG